MENCFRVVIYTPYGKYLSSQGDYLSVKTSSGWIGVLPNHAPLITTLEISKLIIRNGKDELTYAISGGVMNIKKDHTISLMVDTIERKDEIDVERAKASKARAEQRIKDENATGVDITRAKLSLLRALNRIDVSENK